MFCELDRIDVKTYMRLGETFIESRGLTYHNIERHVTIEMWLEGRISSKYVSWLLTRHTPMNDRR